MHRSLPTFIHGFPNMMRSGSTCLVALLCLAFLSGCCKLDALRARGREQQADVVPFNFASPHVEPGQERPDGSLRISGFAVLPPPHMEKKGLLVVCRGGFQPALSLAESVRIFAAAGWVVVAPDYRGVGLSDGRIEFAAGEVEDIRAAANYAAQTFFPHAADGSVDTRILGASHGAFNTLLLLSRPPAVSADGRFGLHRSLAVTKVVLIAPGFDLVELYHLLKTYSPTSPDIEERFGANVASGLECEWIRESPKCKQPATPDTDLEEYLRRSPIHFAPNLPGDVEYLVFHGVDDRLIPISHSERLCTALEGLGASVDFQPIKGLGHMPTPEAEPQLKKLGFAAFCFLNADR